MSKHEPGYCRHCGEHTLWCRSAGEYEDYCDDCFEVMSERSRQAREWASCHDEPCPEIELTPMPSKREAGHAE